MKYLFIQEAKTFYNMKDLINLQIKRLLPYIVKQIQTVHCLLEVNHIYW